jgi:hypothetical protein
MRRSTYLFLSLDRSSITKAKKRGQLEQVATSTTTIEGETAEVHNFLFELSVLEYQGQLPHSFIY